MYIKIPYKYTEQIIPKRCRKPRRVISHGEISLSIHEVTGEEAPVAIRQYTKTFTEDHYEPTIIEYRWLNHRLWTLHTFNRFSHGPYETQTAQQFVQDPWPMTSSHFSTSYQSQRGNRRGLMAWARGILFIDGKRWYQAGEPRYVIMTFGLGHNHGHPGTSLSSDTYYNTNISNSRYFRIDQHDKALETAIAIAERRGDDMAIPFIKDYHDTFD
ncbi:unnamed protein product, partial [marine sediment metagenome]